MEVWPGVPVSQSLFSPSPPFPLGEVEGLPYYCNATSVFVCFVVDSARHFDI